MSNERLGVPDYLRLVREALANTGSTGCEKSPPSARNKPDEETLFSLNTLFSQPIGARPSGYIKFKNISDINDSDIIDEVAGKVGRDGSASACEKSDQSEERVFQHEFEILIARSPIGVSNQRWVQAITDAEGFLVTWGEQARAFGWTAEDLFRLDQVNRYDTMGLLWLLQGCPVVALTERTATIRKSTGNLLTFYRGDVEFSWRRCNRT
jgi:hypothetical protein